MSNSISYSIQNLCTNNDERKGPIKQALFAYEYAKRIGLLYNEILYRITFADNHIHKAFPGAVPLLETLLLGQEPWFDGELHLCIRGEKTYLTVAIGYLSERKVAIQEEYKHAILLGKLTPDQIEEIFIGIWDHTHKIKPCDPAMYDDIMYRED